MALGRKTPPQPIAPASPVGTHLSKTTAMAADHKAAIMPEPDYQSHLQHQARVKAINDYLKEFKGIQFTSAMSQKDLEELLVAIRRQDNAAVEEQLKQLIAEHKVERALNDPTISVSADTREDDARMQGERTKEDLEAKEDAKAVADAVESVRLEPEAFPEPVHVEAVESAAVEKDLAAPEVKPVEAEPLLDPKPVITNKEELTAYLEKSLKLLGLQVDKDALLLLKEEQLIDLMRKSALAYADDANLGQLKDACKVLDVRLEPTPEPAVVRSMSPEERLALSAVLGKVAEVYENELQIRRDQEATIAPAPVVPVASEPEAAAEVTQSAQMQASEGARTAVVEGVDVAAANDLGMDVSKMADNAAAEAVSAATASVQTQASSGADSSPAPKPGMSLGKAVSAEADRFAGPISKQPISSPTGQWSAIADLAKEQAEAELEKRLEEYGRNAAAAA